MALFPDKYKPKPKKTKSYTNILQDFIIAFLFCKGFFASVVHTKGTIRKTSKGVVFAKSKSTKGFPDIVVCCNGLFVAIEIKINKDKQSQEQKIWQENHLRNGGVYIIAKTKEQFEKDFESMLAKLGK